MKPVLPTIKPHDSLRVLDIRENRIADLAEELEEKQKKPTRKKTTKRRKAVELNAETRAALEKLDPATRDFLLQQTKG